MKNNWLFLIKQMASMLPFVFIVTDHRRRHEVVRKATANSAAPRVPLFLSF